MKLKRQKLFSALDPDIIKQFLGRLSGFVHKAKSLHWAATRKDIHEYLDGIWEETYKFQDAVAEGYMGIDGKIDSNVPFLMPEAKSPAEFISELEEKTKEAYELLPDSSEFSGLRGEFESFIQTVEKYKYLFSLCGENNVANEEKEFSEKKEKTGKGALITAGAAGVGSSALFVGSKKLSNRSKLSHDSAIKFENSARHLEHEKKMFEDLAERFKDRGKVTVSGLEEAGAQISNLRNKSEKLAESSRKLSKGSKAAKIGAIGLAATSAAAAGVGISRLSKKNKKN